LTISQDLKDIQQQYLDRGQQVTLCEWKGQANYFDVIAGNRRAENVAWAYKQPTPAMKPFAITLVIIRS
jgi:uncharacterized protein (DUF427 family)